MNTEQENSLNHEIQLALDNCAREPIHIPGSIQSHGFLLVVDNDFKILKASENFLAVCGLELDQLIGTALSRFIQPESIAALEKLVVKSALNALRYCTLTVESTNGPISCDAVLHQSGEVMIVEIEPHQDLDRKLENQDFYQELMQFSVQLHKIESHSDLFGYVVQEVRRLTGFNRVMLYQFDNEWNGQVVAEDKRNTNHSYLGLNFPASDIPEQARKLYSVNYLRLISDINSAPVPILPDDRDTNGDPINLSFSCLRSVSKVHLQYLDNMNVKGSMSISVMQNDRLWGLIACHHDSPYRPAYTVRMAAELIAHTFSAFLSNFMQLQASSDEKVRELKFKELSYALTPDTPLADSINAHHELIMELLDADGIIVKLGTNFIRFGLVPDDPELTQLTNWIEHHTNDQIFVCDSIAESTGLDVSARKVGGAILAPVTHPIENCVMFFRREVNFERHWAGRPEKHISRTDAGFELTPRASFERWKEVVSGHSRTWSEADREMATAISKSLLAKYYEDSLRQATNNMDTVVNNSNALIYIVNTEGIFLQMNDTALEAFGLEIGDVIGNSYHSVLDNALLDVIDKHMTTVLSDNKSSTFTDSFKHKNSDFHLVTVTFPLFDSARQIHSICSMSQDVSELQAIQAELKTSNAELERVAFVASHDLQEPIRLISTFTNLLKLDYADKLDEQAEEYINFTLNAANRMRVLIHDLLEYSRLEYTSLNPPVINAQTVLDELIDELKMTNKLGDARITCDDPLPTIFMKPEHFTCIMQNLISNAIKYKKDSIPVDIRIKTTDDRNYWRFSVTDNGIGVKQEHLKKIFDIFQRLHTNNQYEGTGIGLSLCTKIAKLHGGDAWAESTFGQGSTFHFTILKDIDSLNKIPVCVKDDSVV